MTPDNPEEFPEMISAGKAQTTECPTCGRIALIICAHCHGTSTDEKRYTADEVEEALLRWCGSPARPIEDVRHALMMEACGGVDRGPIKPLEQPT